MIDAFEYWMVAIGLGGGTYLVRASFLLLPNGNVVSEGWNLLLRFIAPSALTAIVVPAVIASHTVELESSGFVKPIAAVCALVVAWKTQNTLATIASGMLVFWGLRWWGSALQWV